MKLLCIAAFSMLLAVGLAANHDRHNKNKCYPSDESTINESQDNTDSGIDGVEIDLVNSHENDKNGAWLDDIPRGFCQCPPGPEVCADDGNTYEGECNMRCAAWLKYTVYHKVHDGPC